MVLRIKDYKDKKLALKTRNKQRKRYYKKTEQARNSFKKWTHEEDYNIFEYGLTDTELSLILGRSVSAIQCRRCNLSKELKNEKN